MSENEIKQGFGPESFISVPYQAAFIQQLVDSIPPARYTLIALPGFGKTVTLAAAANALKAKRGTLRCLSIVSSQLALMWQEQLTRFGGLETVAITPQAYRRLQSESGPGVNIWSRVSSAVASIDFLKTPGRLDEVLAAGWDLVLVDEMHRSADETLRGDLLKKIWNASSVGIAVTTNQLPEQQSWLANDPRTTKVLWTHADLVGKKVMPDRRISVVHYTTSEAERQIALRIQHLFGQAPKNRQTQTTINVLSRRLSSSMYSFEQTLRRLLTVETFGDTDLNDWSPDDLEEDANETTLANSVRIYREAGEEILSLLESEPADSKWECCFHLMNSREIGKTCSGILFTDYVDTAEYLDYLARSRGLKVELITGQVMAQARENALYEARNNPTLLIATGAVEGMDLSFSNQVIHYDLPWNPRRLLQRIGRVERVTSRFKTFDHYYILEQNSASGALADLMEKVKAIEQEWK